MIYCPPKYQKIIRPNVNQELLNLEGELTDQQAKIALGRFLRANLGLGLEILNYLELNTDFIKEYFNNKNN